MTGVVVPVVVVHVPVAVELELGGTTRCVVDVVASESHLITLTVSESKLESNGLVLSPGQFLCVHLHSPVVMTVTASRPAGLTVEFTVRDSNMAS